MRNIVKTFSAIAVSLFLTGAVFAATPSLSIRIQQPGSPTNTTDLKIAVVTLDREGREITVRCFKKGPSDGAFSQFGSDIVINPLGGNSVTCDTNSGVMNTNGTFQFYATAQAGSDSETSATVSVDFNSSGPSTPVSYGKDRINVCDYRITFKTADDAGKTVKVEVYRSENTSFDLNSGSRVDTISIGSNADGTSVTTPPQCNKDYYFAIRAFDAYGNGSGTIGDSVVHTTTTTTTTGSTTTGGGSSSTTAGGSVGAAQGAVAGGNAGNVLGAEITPTPTIQALGGTAGGSVLGETVPTGTPMPDAGDAAKNPFPWKAVAAGLLLIVCVAAVVIRKMKKPPALPTP